MPKLKNNSPELILQHSNARVPWRMDSNPSGQQFYCKSTALSRRHCLHSHQPALLTGHAPSQKFGRTDRVPVPIDGTDDFIHQAKVKISHFVPWGFSLVGKVAAIEWRGRRSIPGPSNSYQVWDPLDDNLVSFVITGLRTHP